MGIGLKLHLGCGARYLDGYVHVDRDTRHAHIDYQQPIDDLSMFEEGAVAMIYASHALSYFDRESVGKVLQEWRRVLVPGGTLRLAVPDFEALTKIYQQTGDLSRVLGPLYGRWEINNGREILYHRTVYDFVQLKGVLEEAGFDQVQRWDWRNVFVGKLKDFDDFSQAYYPHMDKKNGLLLSLNVCATKEK